MAGKRSGRRDDAGSQLLPGARASRVGQMDSGVQRPDATEPEAEIMVLPVNRY